MTTAAPETPAADWYAVLGIEFHASPSEIAAAYQRQRALYDPTHGADMNDDFAALATAQRSAIEAAYATLSDPQQRFRYDESRGLVGDEQADRRGIANRGVIWTIMGVLAGLLLLSLVYNLTASKSRDRQIANGFAVFSGPAPVISARTLDGAAFNLADYRGKVVIVNFWGTWCEPCKEETPALQAAYEKLRSQGLVVVGIDLLDSERAQGRDEGHVRAFTELYGVTYPIALDETGTIAQAYKMFNIPVSFIVDPNGNVRYIRTGQMTLADVEWAFQMVKSS